MWRVYRLMQDNFLGNTEKPDVDSIEGLSPSISIDQKTTSQNPKINSRYGYGNL